MVLMNSLVLPIGLMDALPTFYNLMNSTCSNILDESVFFFFLTICLYSLLIYSHIMMMYVKLSNDYIKTS